MPKPKNRSATPKLTSKNNNSATTNANGQFNLSYDGAYPVTIIVEKSNYESYQSSIENPIDALEIFLDSFNTEDISEITITARRREETAQEVPIPINVISGKRADDAGAFNVNRLKELVPSVQLYSSNPRNTAISIRGLGTTFGLTNDGIDPGVGFYVDGVYYARPAAATLDFIDVERIEVLRGPQGTLFGKIPQQVRLILPPENRLSKPDFLPKPATEISVIFRRKCL